MEKEEFKVPDGEGGLAETFFNPERGGWLMKEVGKYRSKHKRWFVLKERMLYYFKQPSVSSLLLEYDILRPNLLLITMNMSLPVPVALIRSLSEKMGTKRTKAPNFLIIAVEYSVEPVNKISIGLGGSRCLPCTANKLAYV